MSRVAPVIASSAAALPLPIGRSPLPEGAWLRLVAQLDWHSCRALNSTSGDAHLGTTAALVTLDDARRQGQASVIAAMAAFDEEARRNTAANQREQNAAAEALQHMAPLRNGRLTERFGPQLQEIFTQLEEISGGPHREAEAAVARQQRENEAEQARLTLELEARFHIQEGRLLTPEISIQSDSDLQSSTAESMTTSTSSASTDDSAFPETSPTTFTPLSPIDELRQIQADRHRDWQARHGANSGGASTE